MTWDEMRTMPITDADIERARRAGACAGALDWARAEPRTWGEAPPKWVGWYGLHAATPARVSACIAGTDAWWRGWIGCDRDDLTEAQLTACIAGTDAEGRGEIGCDRADLTPAQVDACIEGTTPEWRGWIGAHRADLTPAQVDACIEGTTPEWRGAIGRRRTDLTPAQRAACGVVGVGVAGQ